MDKIKEECARLAREEQVELKNVRDKYRNLLREAREPCRHVLTPWLITPNIEFRYNCLGDPIYHRHCSICQKEETYIGDCGNAPE